nr:hypothetical protein WS70_12405 [Burkholderia mayonis]
MFCTLASIISHAVSWLVAGDMFSAKFFKFSSIAATTTSKIDDGQVLWIANDFLHSRRFEVFSERPLKHVFVKVG